MLLVPWWSSPTHRPVSMADLHEGIGHGSVGLGAGISRQLLQKESSQQQLSSFNSQVVEQLTLA